jgi:hypothetical protein
MRVFVVIPMYRNLYRESVESVVNQTYMPNAVIQVNDDCRANVFDEGFVNDIKVHRWDRCGRHHALKNIHDGINMLDTLYKLKDTDIIILVDGDDELMNSVSISEVVRTYKQYGCWLTHGSYINKSEHISGKVYQLHRGSYNNHEDYRKLPWRASHLKTFLYGLYKSIDKEDFKRDGEWLETCSDLALMFPMLEMAGKEKIRFIEKPLYIYNDMSELNDHKVSPSNQIDTDKWLRAQKPYKKIASISLSQIRN